jgi:hypothetical protein
MMPMRWQLAAVLLAPLVFLPVRAQAQGLRDPTLAPAQAGLVVAEPGGKLLKPELAAMSIIVRDGRSYLAVGTRLYAQGEKIGQARIERISETEVWLREGGVLRKVSQFNGIQRSAVKSAPVPTTQKLPK